jgi:hypothetical protein
MENSTDILLIVNIPGTFIAYFIVPNKESLFHVILANKPVR